MNQKELLQEIEGLSMMLKTEGYCGVIDEKNKDRLNELVNYYEMEYGHDKELEHAKNPRRRKRRSR